MKKIYLGLFLSSLASLALEISLLRLFSMALWYHFAFLVVSIALFGIAFSGTFLFLKPLKNPLYFSCILFSFSAIFGYFIVNSFSFDLLKASLQVKEFLKLSFYYLFLGLPFFFSGLIVAFCLKEFHERAGIIYSINLSGAALGTLLALPLLKFAQDQIIAVIALIGALASLFFIRKKIQIIPILILILIIIFFPVKLKISPYKEIVQALNYPKSQILETQWSTHARIDVVKSSLVHYAPGLSLAYQKPLPEQLGLMIDGSSLNAIINPSDSLEFLDYLPQAIGFQLMEKPKTLVLNSGGGLDVLLALSKTSAVTATESNPTIINLLKGKYKEFSGEIYQKSKVIAEQGRSFVKRKEQFDLIILSQAGSVLASDSGLSNFMENYLLTKEAFQDYHQALSSQGFLIVNRWLSFPPKEPLKLLALALEIEEAQKKIALFVSNQTGTLVLSKNDLTDKQIKIIKDFTASRKYDLIYLPGGDFIPNQFIRFEQLFFYDYTQELLSHPAQFSKNYLFNIEAPTDNKPFYFNFFKWSKIKELYQAYGQRWQPFLDQGFILWFLFFQAIIFGLIFIFLPILALKKISGQKMPLFYFFFIGLGYLFIQVALIQKMILFLGQAVYATSAVITSMLFFASIGSFLSQKYRFSSLPKIIALFCFFLLVYYFFLSPILGYLTTLNLNFKLILSILIISPLALIMGMPFPVALKKIKRELIPYAWSLNGVASVLSSVLATILALFIGYNGVFLGASFVYLLALIVFSKKLTGKTEQ